MSFDLRSVLIDFSVLNAAFCILSIRVVKLGFWSFDIFDMIPSAMAMIPTAEG